MILIVIQHYLVHGLDYASNNFFNANNTSDYPWHMGLMGISMLGVTGFMFISGYYGINFKLERLKSLWWQAAFYVLILGIALYFLSGRFLGFTLLFWLPFGHGGWWYLISYVMIYILSPIINRGVEHLSKSEFKIVLILLFGFLYIDQFTSFNYGTDLSLLLFIYCLGRYIRKFNTPPILQNHLTIVIIVGSCFLFIIPVLLGLVNQSQLLVLFFSNYNPIVLLTSVSIVLVIVNKRLEKVHPIIVSLLSNTLAIYLITDYRPVRYWIRDTYIKGTDYSIGEIVLMVILISIGCLIIEEVRKIMMKGIEKIRIPFLERKNTSI